MRIPIDLPYESSSPEQQPGSSSSSISPPIFAQIQAQSPGGLRIPELLKRYPVNLPKYTQFRAYLHKNPELSTFEKNTAAFVVVHLSLLGVYEIHKDIGGHGVAAVLRNGDGPTILLRADMDALPVKEQTGLSYASVVEQVDFDGVVKPVMHACGHDIHITSLLGAGERLAAMRQHWSGTLILLFQPAEERFGGAERMVADGLYTRVPIPDILLGQHVGPQRAGRIGMVSGISLTGSDTLKITINGRGGHASQPNVSIDPIVIMAACILRLQTIVSREIDPGKEFAVVTVGQVNAGDAPNVIPASAEFHVNIRTVDEDIRSRVLASIDRIVRAECLASGADSDPVIELQSSFPVTYNSPKLTQIVGQTFGQVFGEEFRPKEFPRANASEDFPNLAKAIGRPYCYWGIGGTEQELFDGGDVRKIPGNHSAFFAPAMSPTIKVGIDAMTAGALTFLR